MKKILLVFAVISSVVISPILAFEPVSDTNSMKLIRNIEARGGEIFNLTFKSEIDGTYQPMLVKIPDSYTDEKEWGLLVVLHGLGGGPIVVPAIDNVVQIGPFGRGDKWYKGIGEEDVFECVGLARRIFNIDPERIYLTGFSMGGAGTFSLGLKYPDFWAACVPVCGTLDDHNLVSNGGNLPFWINTGSEDKVILPKRSKMIYEQGVQLGFRHWKYTEYDGMGHSFRVDWRAIERWLLMQKKIKSPPVINFTTYEPASAYWTEIMEKKRKSKYAKIEIETTAQKIDVRTFNVKRYKLFLKDAPVNLSQPVTIIENSKNIYQGKMVEGRIFVREVDC